MIRKKNLLIVALVIMSSMLLGIVNSLYASTVYGETNEKDILNISEDSDLYSSIEVLLSEILEDLDSETEIWIFLGFIHNQGYDLGSEKDLIYIRDNKETLLARAYDEGILEPPSRYKTSTHKKITIRVLQELIDPEYKAVGTFYRSLCNENTSTLGNALGEKSTEPDSEERDTIVGIPTMAGHFYNPSTGLNKYNLEAPTARERFITRYNDAVAAYRNGNDSLAIHNLGYALHYLQDLGTPVHTGEALTFNPQSVGINALAAVGPFLLGVWAAELAAMGIIHLNYENYIDNYYLNGITTLSTLPNIASLIDSPITTLVDDLAEFSYDYYSYAVSGNHNIAANNTVTETEKYVAAVLIKFYFDAENANVSAGTYYVKNYFSGKYFTVLNNSTSGGVDIYQYSGTATQKRVTVYTYSTGYIRMKMVHSGRYLTVNSNGNLEQKK